MAEWEQEARRRELAITADPRAVRTRTRLVDALDELLESGETVSVAAVCAKAGVGRSTFYTHFAAISDIVVYVVDEIFDDISRRDVRRRTVPAADRRTITELGVRELLRAIDARQRFFVYAVSAAATDRIRERVAQDMTSGVRASILAERPDASDHFVQTASDYIAGGLLGILVGWMTRPDLRDEDAVAAAIVELLPRWLTAS
ncbi:hypothetical protein AB0N73_15775 [Microbacterium sp. NPDC089189]|uniref:TetR/AcrR family transcriptional regulator n=1 Tax=Microbacterium sp. NPDC089189 TaxID=3154972 RepID=UPI00342191B2